MADTATADPAHPTVHQNWYSAVSVTTRDNAFERDDNDQLTDDLLFASGPTSAFRPLGTAAELVGEWEALGSFNGVGTSVKPSNHVYPLAQPGSCQLILSADGTGTITSPAVVGGPGVRSARISWGELFEPGDRFAQMQLKINGRSTQDECHALVRCVGREVVLAGLQRNSPKQFAPAFTDADVGATVDIEKFGDRMKICLRGTWCTVMWSGEEAPTETSDAVAIVSVEPSVGGLVEIEGGFTFSNPVAEAAAESCPPIVVKPGDIVVAVAWSTKQDFMTVFIARHTGGLPPPMMSAARIEGAAKNSRSDDEPARLSKRQRGNSNLNRSILWKIGQAFGDLSIPQADRESGFDPAVKHGIVVMPLVQCAGDKELLEAIEQQMRTRPQTLVINTGSIQAAELPVDCLSRLTGNFRTTDGDRAKHEYERGFCRFGGCVLAGHAPPVNGDAVLMVAAGEKFALGHFTAEDAYCVRRSELQQLAGYGFFESVLTDRDLFAVRPVEWDYFVPVDELNQSTRVRLARSLSLFGQVKEPASTLQLLRTKGEILSPSDKPKRGVKDPALVDPVGVEQLAKQGWSQTGDELCGQKIVKDFDGEEYGGKISWWHPHAAWFFVEYDDGDTETLHSREEAIELVVKGGGAPSEPAV